MTNHCWYIACIANCKRGNVARIQEERKGCEDVENSDECGQVFTDGLAGAMWVLSYRTDRCFPTDGEICQVCVKTTCPCHPSVPKFERGVERMLR